MQYPNRVIRKGETDRAIVSAVQAQLVAQGCGPVDDAGVFGDETEAAVMLFQARHVDGEGRPLRQDGAIGPLTWTALFGPGTVPDSTPSASPFVVRVLAKASSQVGVLEQPKDSNSGPEVDEYLRRAGVPLSLPPEQKPWCCSFVYWCFDETARALGRPNPMVRTAGCLDHWNLAETHHARRVPADRAAENPGLVVPGMVFVMNHGGGRGHTGFVERVIGGLLHTIEGNTDASRTREGGGVYRLQRRLGEINTGFIDYSAAV
jgi:CHAP domain-containing protein/putative peptidoglycan binding protein